MFIASCRASDPPFEFHSEQKSGKEHVYPPIIYPSDEDFKRLAEQLLRQPRDSRYQMEPYEWERKEEPIIVDLNKTWEKLARAARNQVGLLDEKHQKFLENNDFDEINVRKINKLSLKDFVSLEKKTMQNNSKKKRIQKNFKQPK